MIQVRRNIDNVLLTYNIPKEVCPTIQGKPQTLLSIITVESTHETPRATGIASFRSTTIYNISCES